MVFRVLRLNHIAIATKDSSSLADFYRKVLKLNVSSKVAQPEHGVYTTFVEFPEKSTNIELLEPLGDKSPIAKFIEKSDEGVHHFCFEVDNLKTALEHVTKNCMICPLGREPKIGAHGNPVIFLHPKDCQGFLTELEESAEK